MFMGEEQIAEEMRQCEEARETKWTANSVFGKATRGRWEEERMARFERWNDNRVQVMREVLRAKAMGCEEYVRELRESKGRILMEVVPGDDFWGVASGAGHNWLGRLHMELREELEESQVEDLRGQRKEREPASESREGGPGVGKRSVKMQGEPVKRGRADEDHVYANVRGREESQTHGIFFVSSQLRELVTPGKEGLAASTIKEQWDVKMWRGGGEIDHVAKMVDETERETMGDRVKWAVLLVGGK